MPNPLNRVAGIYAKANNPDAAWTPEEKEAFAHVFHGEHPPNPRASMPVAPAPKPEAPDMTPDQINSEFDNHFKKLGVKR